jgi:hypothetical protein
MVTAVVVGFLLGGPDDRRVILDGGSRSLDPAPHALARLARARIPA